MYVLFVFPCCSDVTPYSPQHPIFGPIAAVEGDLERAILQLNRRDFCLEIRYVCSPVSGIDVNFMVGKLGIGIQRLLRQEEQILDDVMCYRYAGRSWQDFSTSEKHKNNILSSLSYTILHHNRVH